VVRAAIARGTPFFGICLGLQVLFEESDEEPGCRGLGVFSGRVRRFAVATTLKIPHMGWNACARGPAAAGADVLAGTPDETAFYFVHSYFAVPAVNGAVALTAEHGERFCAAIARDNVFACQFHPEKSQTAGLALLRRFVAV
jgi:glutamine amidotransferase